MVITSLNFNSWMWISTYLPYCLSVCLFCSNLCHTKVLHWEMYLKCLKISVSRSPCGDTYVYNIPWFKPVLPVLYYRKNICGLVDSSFILMRSKTSLLKYVEYIKQFRNGEINGIVIILDEKQNQSFKISVHPWFLIQFLMWCKVRLTFASRDRNIKYNVKQNKKAKYLVFALHCLLIVCSVFIRICAVSCNWVYTVIVSA